MAEAGDPQSMLTLHRDLLRLRRAHPALSIGAIHLIEAEGDVLAYERVQDGERIVVALNLGDREQAMPVPAGAFRVLLSTLGTPTDPPPGGGGFVAENRFTLSPNEGLILLMDTPA
jgi:alpha-glucosidase